MRQTLDRSFVRSHKQATWRRELIACRSNKMSSSAQDRLYHSRKAIERKCERLFPRDGLWTCTSKKAGRLPKKVFFRATVCGIPVFSSTRKNSLPWTPCPGISMFLLWPRCYARNKISVQNSLLYLALEAPAVQPAETLRGMQKIT